MITKIIPLNIKHTYPLEQRYPISQILFFDIETTGLSPRYASVYLIGAIYYTGSNWEVIQWFAQSLGEEPLILKEFLKFAASYKYLIHFNADTFDLPFLRFKSDKYQYEFTLDNLTSIDLYRTIRPYKKWLNLSKMNQKALESHFNISRKDTFDGGALISLYHEYVKTASDVLLSSLLLHNYDDLQGMLQLLVVLSYRDFMDGKFQLINVHVTGISDESFSASRILPKLHIQLNLETPLPLPLCWSLENIQFKVQEEFCFITVNGIFDTLKHFFTNYRDYYYLPAEDTAMHKSIASYVDKNHRQPAKASNCYCKKEGIFFPQKNIQFHPSFKKEYSDSGFYFEYLPDIISNSEAVRQYVINLLQDSLSCIL